MAAKAGRGAQRAAAPPSCAGRDSRGAGPRHSVLALQRRIGNRATGALLAAQRLAPGAPGEPLARPARRLFEPRFGRDFGDVRVHTDEKAAVAAEGIGAAAFTVGSHLYFGRDRYRPNAPGGQRLIAHELAHVAQQGPAVPNRPAEVALSDPRGPAERDAHATAQRAMLGPVSVKPRPSEIGTLFRQPCTPPTSDSECAALPCGGMPFPFPFMFADEPGVFEHYLIQADYIRHISADTKAEWSVPCVGGRRWTGWADLVDFRNYQIWEIKPESLEFFASTEALLYVRAANTWCGCPRVFRRGKGYGARTIIILPDGTELSAREGSQFVGEEPGAGNGALLYRWHFSEELLERYDTDRERAREARRRVRRYLPRLVKDIPVGQEDELPRESPQGGEREGEREAPDTETAPEWTPEPVDVPGPNVGPANEVETERPGERDLPQAARQLVELIENIVKGIALGVLLVAAIVVAVKLGLIVLAKSVIAAIIGFLAWLFGLQAASAADKPPEPRPEQTPRRAAEDLRDRIEQEIPEHTGDPQAPLPPDFPEPSREELERQAEEMKRQLAEAERRRRLREALEPPPPPPEIDPELFVYTLAQDSSGSVLRPATDPLRGSILGMRRDGRPLFRFPGDGTLRDPSGRVVAVIQSAANLGTGYFRILRGPLADKARAHLATNRQKALPRGPNLYFQWDR